MNPTRDAGSEMSVALEAARRGDADARGALLEKHRGYLKLLCRLELGPLLRAKVDASDVVQESFLRAHAGFPSFRGTTDAELRAWLRRILARQLANVIRHYRGTRRRDVRLERDLDRRLGQSSEALGEALVLDVSSPSQRAVRNEQVVALADALERLPEDYRTVILLHHVQGLEFARVAQLMDRTVGSVEKLWLRALAKLRGEIGRAS